MVRIRHGFLHIEEREGVSKPTAQTLGLGFGSPYSSATECGGGDLAHTWGAGRRAEVEHAFRHRQAQHLGGPAHGGRAVQGRSAPTDALLTVDAVGSKWVWRLLSSPVCRAASGFLLRPRRCSSYSAASWAPTTTCRVCPRRCRAEKVPAAADPAPRHSPQGSRGRMPRRAGLKASLHRNWLDQARVIVLCRRGLPGQDADIRDRKPRMIIFASLGRPQVSKNRHKETIHRNSG
jgi:hypothetical protein